jgi:hypothetical protein
MSQVVGARFAWFACELLDVLGKEYKVDKRILSAHEQVPSQNLWYLGALMAI